MMWGDGEGEREREGEVGIEGRKRRRKKAGKGSTVGTRDGWMDKWIHASKRTRAPTVIPAATDGIDPVRIYPVRPPPAVSRARKKASFEAVESGVEAC